MGLKLKNASHTAFMGICAAPLVIEKDMSRKSTAGPINIIARAGKIRPLYLACIGCTDLLCSFIKRFASLMLRPVTKTSTKQKSAKTVRILSEQSAPGFLNVRYIYYSEIHGIYLLHSVLVSIPQIIN